MVGLFSEQAVLKLTEIAESLLASILAPVDNCV